MKYRYISIIVLSVFTLFFSGKKHQKNSAMDIPRGLQSSISEFTNLEQKLILKVAKKLESNGFPINQLTRIHLKKRIDNTTDYYSDNEITFFVNPGIYKKDKFNWGIENIGIDWEDPSVIRTPDGGIEFEVGRKINPEDLIMNLYRLQDSYDYGTLLKDHNVILKKINKTIVSSTLEEIKYFTANGVAELIKNYLIVLTQEQENIYEMTIRRMDNEFIDVKHFNTLFEQYRLKINLNTSRIEILDRFDPTFFPTPVAHPPTPIIKNKN